MRSMHMVAASQNIGNETTAARTNADALIIDLVDKDLDVDLAQVRCNAINIISRARQSEGIAKLYIRIHRLDTQECKDDLEWIIPQAPDGIFLSHCHNGADVQHLAGLLAVQEAENNLVDGSTKIIASVASDASSIFELKSFQGANRRLMGLCWDAAELAMSLGLSNTINMNGEFLPPLSVARALTLYAAKAAQLFAFDTAAFHSTDAASFQRECEAALRDGFNGKIGRNLEQIEMINDLFPEKAL